MSVRYLSVWPTQSGFRLISSTRFQIMMAGRAISATIYHTGVSGDKENTRLASSTSRKARGFSRTEIPASPSTVLSTSSYKGSCAKQRISSSAMSWRRAKKVRRMGIRACWPALRSAISQSDILKHAKAMIFLTLGIFANPSLDRSSWPGLLASHSTLFCWKVFRTVSQGKMGYCGTYSFVTLCIWRRRRSTIMGRKAYSSLNSSANRRVSEVKWSTGRNRTVTLPLQRSGHISPTDLGRTYDTISRSGSSL